MLVTLPAVPVLGSHRRAYSWRNWMLGGWSWWLSLAVAALIALAFHAAFITLAALPKGYFGSDAGGWSRHAANGPASMPPRRGFNFSDLRFRRVRLLPVIVNAHKRLRLCASAVVRQPGRLLIWLTASSRQSN
jgi:hypothetical protein